MGDHLTRPTAGIQRCAAGSREWIAKG